MTTSLVKVNEFEGEYAIAVFRDVQGTVKCTLLQPDHPGCLPWVKKRVKDGSLIELIDYDLPEENTNA